MMMNKNGLTKKLMAFAAFACALVAALTGCNKDERVYKNCGIKLSVPEEFEKKGLIIESYGLESNAIPLVMVNFQYEPGTAKVMEEFNMLAPEELTDEVIEEFNQKYLQHYKNLMNIYVLTQEDYDEYFANDNFPLGVEKLAEKNDRIYLIDIFPEDTEGMEMEEIDLYTQCRNYMLKAKDKIKFVKIEDNAKSAPQESLPDMPEALPSFTSTDVFGNEVTDKIFSEKDLTVVNIWGTFCGPCIKEMPELAEWSKKMPSNVQLVGIICDVSSASDRDGIENAKEILRKAGVDFSNIISNEDFEEFMQSVMFVPTTFLVDKNGKIVDGPVTGAKVSEYKALVEKHLNAK